ncbi:sugar ABC transporter substrate-binding protein [Pararhodobacter sp.]|uniref:sugar ABC transporter substrate-binding protein n=1 Tax=Pararhodobacter sp. TaxID=2127056 RepID=UPI002AFFEC2F|nr:sugar ABC transporter substrate-binding protein [Pararhodobacter sp.]
MKNLVKSVVGVAALMCGTSAIAQDAVQVGIVAVNYNSPSIQVQTDAAVAAAEARGWEVEMYDGQGDQVATNNAAIAFIDRGFDAIINIASANTQMSAVIAYANNAGVPFTSTFSGLVPGIVADIGSNNTADAAIAALELVGRIDGQGHVVKFNWNVLPALRERDQGFHAVVDEYPGITLTEIEVRVPGQVDDAFAQMTNLLLANDDIVAVWVAWDELASPVARAIEQAGRADDIFVASQDGVDEVVSLIRDGSPVALTVAYNVPQMGVTAVDVTAAALNGEFPTSRALTLKPCLITQATAPAEGEAIDFANCTLFSGQ